MTTLFSLRFSLSLSPPNQSHYMSPSPSSYHRSLFKNQLTSVPPEIGRLTSLPRLSLYENNISHLPPEMGDMSGLVEL